MSDPTVTSTTTAGVGVRTVVVGGMPLLIAGVPDHGPAAELLAAVAARGLRPLAGVTGVELPRGAEVGFVVDTAELRLVDADDRALLRAPRSGLDPVWLDTAKRLKGTMTVLVRDLELDADSRPDQLVASVDAAGSDGRVLGAIVGLLEERPQLPLLFG